MSLAPLPSLRSLWANGGAPGAFVRADHMLTLHLEQLLRAGNAAQSMAHADTYSRLVHDFTWADLLPEESSAGVTDDADVTPAHRNTRAWPVTPGRAVSPPAAPAHTTAPASRAGSRASAPTDPSRRLPALTHTAQAGAPKHAAAHAAPARNVRDGAHASPGDSTAAGADVATPHDASPAAWRRVAPLSAHPDGAHAARVAAVLADYAQPAMNQLRVAAHTPAERAPATASAAGNAPMSQLGTLVRRVELQRAAARRESRNAAAASADAVHRSPRFTHSDELTPPRSHAAWPAPADDEILPAPAVGMRGLVDRARATRADFFFGNTVFEDVPWPDGEFDAFSSQLDDAARRDGIDLEEALS